MRRKPLPDILAELPRHQRERREAHDGGYLLAWVMTHGDHCFGTAEGQRMGEFFGIKLNRVGGGDIGVVVCARVDLDHLIQFPDNFFTDCADCDCRVQLRPDAPATGDRLCISCAARRLRLEAVDGK